jgi:hypothetical protein
MNTPDFDNGRPTGGVPAIPRPATAQEPALAPPASSAAISSGLSRRAALIGALASSITLVPALVLQVRAEERRRSAQERFDHHLAGLQAAAAELNGEVSHWHVCTRDWGTGCRIAIIGTDQTTVQLQRPIGGYFADADFQSARRS